MVAPDAGDGIKRSASGLNDVKKCDTKHRFRVKWRCTTGGMDMVTTTTPIIRGQRWRMTFNGCDRSAFFMETQ